MIQWILFRTTACVNSYSAFKDLSNKNSTACLFGSNIHTVQNPQPKPNSEITDLATLWWRRCAQTRSTTTQTAQFYLPVIQKSCPFLQDITLLCRKKKKDGVQHSTECPHSLLIDGGCAIYNNILKVFPPCSTPGFSSIQNSGLDQALWAAMHRWSDSKPEWDRIEQRHGVYFNFTLLYGTGK